MKDNMNEFRVLDPVKVSWMGLARYVQAKKATLAARLARLEQFSRDKNTPDQDRQDMKKIGQTLSQIMSCNFCQGVID